MTRAVGRESTRERILSAAEDVVLVDGVAHLTLEKAAARAGLSKGGVLYHFPSRGDLVAGMVERLAERFDAAVLAHLAGEAPGAFARAYVEETVAPIRTEDEARSQRVGAAVIAAIASQPELLAPLRAAFARWQGRLEAEAPDDAAAARATVARLAADGLWLCELLGLDALTPTMRNAVHDELRRMVSDS